ncbi:MAG: radical SAM protein [Deltaproteobacteria bacterium]|nr:radical SAM protein [Deltaproteobacteria bacterium]
MEYEEPLFRPPSEAASLILQATIGCSHNRCAFCSMYQTKKFRVRPSAELRAEIATARRALGPDVGRVFLADGDAMCLSTRRLVEILDAVRASFPRLQRVSAYANARDILHKSDTELTELRQRKLKLLYLGLESGDDFTLTAIEKGATVDQIVTAVQRARAAGMATSVMVLIGLAGRERSLEHARLSAAAINRMEPEFTALLTYTPVPGSPLFERIARGDFELPGPRESIAEIREFVKNLDCRTYFTCNHASNYLPLTGRLPTSKRHLLELLDAGAAGAIALKPEFLRGL